MTSGSDVRDILELETPEKADYMTKEAVMADKKRKIIKKPDAMFKRPEGMHRELWGLLWTDCKDAPPIMPTETGTHHGYKQMKAKIGRSQVRPWKWMPFTNPARKDGAIFFHWRRHADEGKDYPFAKFNKSVDIPVYSDLEYQQHLHDDGWTRQETDHLFDLCKRFDLRFMVIQDRWDKERYNKRSVEDIKERYYNICNMLSKVRAPQGSEPKVRAFDAEHERRRKTQLNKLYNRTPKQVEEEEQLIQELKKIELRKKEREKKTQDLQKLITAADSNIDAKKMDRKMTKKKFTPTQKLKEGIIKTTPDTTGIKFPDVKTSGVTLRSQRMKLPGSVGQKKIKAIEQVMDELRIEFSPMPTEEVVPHFNELRQDIVLLYELKLALANCEYELQTLKHRHETVSPSHSQMIVFTPTKPDSETPVATPEITDADSPAKARMLSESIDIHSTPVGTPHGTPGTPIRKRKAALEQSNMLKKIKQKV